MNKVLTSVLFSFIAIAAFSAEDAPYKSYLELLKEYPQTLGPWGKAQEKEIEIIRDPVRMKEIEDRMGRKVGIVARDNYWMWVNDAVEFPNGKTGIYARLLWVKSLKGPAGVAVLAILPNNKIVLNCNYRHATRSWELELPRGGKELNESIEDAAKREVKEETGMVISELQSLGEMAPDSGLTNSIVPIYMAKVIAKENAAPEDSEAIAKILAFSYEDLKKAFLKGSITLDIEGETKQVFVRDPFLAFALFKADLKSNSGEEISAWKSQPHPSTSSSSSLP